MKEIVSITTYRRNELLYVCLDAIRREEPDITVRVNSDRGYTDDDLEAICHQFDCELSVAGTRGYGNSFNTLSSLRVAAGIATGIVHSIEDDTIVHPGYFRWARGVLGMVSPQPMFAVVCGRIASPHITDWYESPCASWRVPQLTVALGMVIEEYFADTREEMQKVLDQRIFPESKYKGGGAEQDGFFLRCIEHFKWHTKFPPKPLATHLGWYGYNSPPSREIPAGSLADRVRACREMFKNIARRKELFGHRITEAEVSGINGL